MKKRKEPKKPPVNGEGADCALSLTDGRDLALVGRAIKQRWPVSPALRKKVADAMEPVLADPKDARAAVNAARVLVAMEAQNQTDDHADDKNARIDAGKSTERTSTAVRIIFSGINSRWAGTPAEPV